MQDILPFLQHHWILSTCLLVIFVFLTLLEFSKMRGGSSRLTPSEVTSLINHENATIIDLRPSNTYSTGHIVGAVSLPAKELGDKIKRIEKFKTSPVVLVCEAGTESTQAHSQLTKNGFQKVYVLSGGIRAWKMAEMPLVKD